MTRPAYDEATLARAIRQGVDPDGDALMAPMPRFGLDDQAFSALFAYLRQLSAEPSPGIEAHKLRLATVVAPDAPAGAPEAVLGVLRAFTAQRQGEMPWDLQVWQLSGPPETWEAQLDDHYRQQPVFAVLSGVGGAEWSPVQRFCKRHSVACVLPSLEATPNEVGTDEGFYSLYFSPGVKLEAELLARYLGSKKTSPGNAHRIVQIFSDASGEKAAATLRELAQASSQQVSERQLHHIAPAAAALEGLSEADALVLWLRPSEIAALAAQTPQGPPAEHVFLSALLAPPEAVSLPPAWKGRITYVSLFDDWDEKSAYPRTWFKGWLKREGLQQADNPRLQSDAYGASYFFAKALARMQQRQLLWRNVNLTRTFLMESLESAVAKNTGDLMDVSAWTPLYGRLSLGVGQRVADKTGYLLRYASPESDTLTPIEETNEGP
jgi:hypothetical protein